MKTQAMNESWQLMRSCSMKKSDAMRKGWLIARVKREMLKRVVAFEYKKRDGSIRKALGTLQERYIPETKGCNRKQNRGVQTYYDAEKNEWRCFKKADLIRITI